MTTLGRVCHRVLARAADGKLGTPGEGDWRGRFEDEWERALSDELKGAQELVDSGAWPHPEKWPFYGQRKAATRRISKQVATERAAAGFECVAEESQVATNEHLRGQPDLVVRQPFHEIRDYKTGDVLEEDGHVRPEYELQIQLYAVLEHETVGKWPNRGVLIPLPGEPAEVAVDPSTALGSAAGVANALELYNAAVARDSLVEHAAPSPEHCRYCDHAPECPAFWASWDPTWVAVRLGAVAGEVTDVRQSLRGGLAVDVLVEAGGDGSDVVSVHGLESSDFGHRLPQPGDAVAIVGVQFLDPGHVKCGRATRTKVGTSPAAA